MILPRKYHIVTSNNLRSKLFLVTNTENCQLLRDIDFSVLANEDDVIKLKLYDKKIKLIEFDYIVDKKRSFYKSFFYVFIYIHLYYIFIKLL